jgi:hypothetical protein
MTKVTYICRSSKINSYLLFSFFLIDLFIAF